MSERNKFHMSRRDLLKTGGLTAGLLLSSELVGCAHFFSDDSHQAKNPEILNSTGFVITDINSEKQIPGGSLRSRYDTPTKLLFSNFSGTKINENVSLAFMPHQTIQNPQVKDQFVSIQKWGKNAVIFNFNNPTELKKFVPPEGFVFFGHGAFTPDGQQVMISSSSLEDSRGEVLIYDVKTQVIIYRISTMGSFPHEIQLSKDGQTLFVMNAGFKKADRYSEETDFPSIAKIDLKARKVVGKVISPLKEDYSHFVTADERNFVFMGTGVQGSLSIMGPDQFVNLTQDPLLKGQLIGEALSGRVLRDGQHALITLNESHKVVLIDIPNGRVLKAFTAHNPHGIAFYGQEPEMLISRGNRKDFLIFSPEKNELVKLTNFKEVPSEAATKWIAGGPHFTEIIWPEA